MRWGREDILETKQGTPKLAMHKSESLWKLSFITGIENWVQGPHMQIRDILSTKSRLTR